MHLDAYLNIILDVAVAALLVIYTVRGCRRGLILTVAGLVKVVVAIIGASVCARLFGPMLAAAILPVVHEELIPAVAGALSENIDLSALADSSLADMSVFGVRLGDFLQSGADAVIGEEGIVVSAALAISEELASAIATSIVAIASFVVILIAVSLIAHLLDLAARLPVLGTLNRGLGLAAGFVMGCVVVMFLVSVAGLFDGYIPPETADSTCLFKFFRDISPIKF